jgi:hypothetical protein
MSVVKNAKIVYVASIPALSVPAHVRIEWRDELNRRNSYLLPLTDEDVARIAKLPDMPLHAEPTPIPGNGRDRSLKRDKMDKEPDLNHIKQLAQEATQGDWKAELDVFSEEEGIVATICDDKVNMLAIIDTEIKNDWDKARQSQALKDAKYIAAVSPQVVLKLLKKISKLEEDNGILKVRLNGIEMDTLVEKITNGKVY